MDTFYIQKNINNKNIYIEFYKKQNDNFELIDWTRVFDEEFDVVLTLTLDFLH